AGAELLREANRLLIEIDAVANRVKRVATGWEAQFTIAVDTIISRPTVMELCDAFYALSPPTQIRLRHESLSGTLEALTSGQADLALGTGPDSSNVSGLQTRLLGSTRFVFAVAPHHPLAAMPEPLGDELIQRYRAVAVADSVQRGNGLTFGIFSGQQVFTVASMWDKLEAHLRGLGVGNLPLGMVQRYLKSGQLVVKQTERPNRLVTVHYAWKKANAQNPGRAMQWWLGQLESVATRAALLERHGGY
ncbi:MAG: LysR substrate-binding domain-containing protein, partial [Rhodoferax sp.]|nr:LysR substrate-binding domain-containing protein [Rhodoferax sp.]